MGVLTAHPEADKVTSTSRELKPKRERKILTTTLIFLVLSDGKLLALDIFREEVTLCLGFSCRLRNQQKNAGQSRFLLAYRACACPSPLTRNNSKHWTIFSSPKCPSAPTPPIVWSRRRWYHWVARSRSWLSNWTWNDWYVCMYPSGKP